MGTFAAGTVKLLAPVGNAKIAVIQCAGSASYATGGDTLDLSSAATGLGDAWSGFSEVYSVVCSGISVAASSKYDCRFIAAASGAPATGKIKIGDQSQAADAEVTAATDLSGTTFTLTVMGR